MDIQNYIQNNTIAIIFFTNSNFNDLNNKIKCLKHNILFIDSNINHTIIESLNIKCVPLFHIYKNGTLIEEIFGTYPNIIDIIRLHF